MRIVQFASSCWTLPPDWNVATALISIDDPVRASGASPERTLSSQLSQVGSCGDENEAPIAATEHCGSQTRGDQDQGRPAKAILGGLPLMHRVNSRKIHFLSGTFFASIDQMWLPLDCRCGVDEPEDTCPHTESSPWLSFRRH